MGDRSERLARSLRDAWDSAGYNAYKRFVLPRQTSYGVTDFDDGTPKEVRETAQITVLSLPFTINNEWHPALKNNDPLKEFDKSMPHVLLTFDEGTKTRGDEVVIIEVRGSLKQYFPKSSFLTWRLYEPGEYEVHEFTGGNERSIKINARDLTANHVVMNLCQRFAVGSSGKVKIHPEHLYDALGKLTKNSDSLKDRWLLLEDRLKCEVFVLKYPEVSAVVFQSIAATESDDFKEFVQDIRDGKLSNWTRIMTRLDQMPRLLVDPRAGSILAALFYQGLTLRAGPDVASDVSSFPPSVLVSVAGLRYFNTLMGGYETELQRLITGVAEKSLESQKESILYLKELQQVKIDGWIAARNALKEGLRQLKPAVRDQVLGQITALQDTMGDLIVRQTDAADGIDHSLTNERPLGIADR